MKRNNYIKASDVADQFGVSRQTIRNWVSRGLLQGEIIEHVLFIFGPSLKNIDRLVEDGDIDAKIEEYEKGLAAAKKDYLASVSELQECAKGNRIITARKKLFMSLLSDFYRMASRTPDRATEMVELLLDGTDVKSIAKEYHVTPARVLQILDGEMAWVEQRTKELTKKFGEFLVLTEENAALREKLDYVTNINEADVRRFTLTEPTILTKNLFDFGLSTRAINCCRGHRVFTVGDLVRNTRQEVLDWRNLGKLTLKELDDVVRQCNLEWGRRYIVNEDGQVLEISELRK